jgi:hypothetical protein
MDTFFRYLRWFDEFLETAGWSGYGIIADIVVPWCLILLILLALRAKSFISSLTNVVSADVPKWLSRILQARLSLAIFTVVTLYLIFRREEYDGPMVVLIVVSLGSIYWYCWRSDDGRRLALELVSRVEKWHFLPTIAYCLLVLISVGLTESGHPSPLLGVVLYELIPLIALPPYIVLLLWMNLVKPKKAHA